MRTVPLRAASAFVALAFALPLSAFASGKPFVGPSGWSHTVQSTATAQMPRAQETWKKGDGEQITLLSDAGLGYADTLSSIQKNISANGWKPAVDKDRTCDGKHAHEVEMTIGTSSYHQILVDDSPGLTKLTYIRPQGTGLTPEVASAISAYCGS